MNFISGWTYSLKVNGIEYEESLQADSGVPQGSHIGPLLFILFTSDITLCTQDTDTQLSLYADDTKFFRVVNNDIDSANLQKAVNNLCDWSRRNLLDLNEAKTQHVTYRRRRNINYWSVIYISGAPIAKTDTVRDLGDYYDSHLTFSYHVDQITARVKAIYGLAFRFVREMRCQKLILTIFDVYAAPILEYCSFIWDRNLTGISHRIEQIHHHITRIALGTPYRTDFPGYKSFPVRV